MSDRPDQSTSSDGHEADPPGSNDAGGATDDAAEDQPRRLFPNMAPHDAQELREYVRESGRQPTNAEISESQGTPFEPSGWPSITENPDFEPGIYGTPVGSATLVTTPDLGIPVDLIETTIGWVAHNADLDLFRGGYQPDEVLRSFDDAVAELHEYGRLTDEWAKQRLADHHGSVARWGAHDEAEAGDPEAASRNSPGDVDDQE